MIKTGMKDYLWSYFAYALKFGINLLIIPITLNMLSTQEYGLWVTFSSIGSIINLFDFGFSSTMLRNMSYVWGGAQTLQAEGYEDITISEKRNDRLFVLTLKSCQRIYSVVSLIAALISYTIALFYVFKISENMNIKICIIAWLIYAASMCFNLKFGYWTVALKSIGAIEQSQKAVVAGCLIQLLVSYMGVRHGGGIIALSLAFFLCTALTRIISVYYLKNYENIGTIIKENAGEIKGHEISKMFKILWKNAKKAGISSIFTVGMIQSTALLSSAYFGVAVTGAYGLCYQLLSTLTSVAQIFYQTTLPKLLEARVNRKKEKSQNLFSMSVVICWFIFILGFLIVVLLGQPIFVYIGSQTRLDIGLFLFMSVISFGEMNYSMSSSYISLGNELPFVRSLGVTSLFVIAISVIVSELNYGIWGILIVRFFCEAIYIFWKWPLVAKRQLGLNTIGIIKCGVGEMIHLLKNLQAR